MRKLISAAVVLLLLTNTFVLSGIAYNRSGEPIASLMLTERELGLRQYYASAEENSGTSLTLEWDSVYRREKNNNGYYYRYNPVWLDSIKLQALGFDLASIRGSKKRQRYSWSGEVQSVVFVLEYDGAAFQQALKQEQAELDDMLAETQEPVDDRQQKELDNKKNDLKRMQLSNTRLYVIDAATDEQALFKKYADKNKYLFARGEVGLNWEDEALTGRIKELFINEIHVPLPDSRQVQTITQGKRLYSYGTEPVAPRYRVKLNIGQRFEPWIEAVYQ